MDPLTLISALHPQGADPVNSRAQRSDNTVPRRPDTDVHTERQRAPVKWNASKCEPGPIHAGGYNPVTTLRPSQALGRSPPIRHLAHSTKPALVNAAPPRQTNRAGQSERRILEHSMNKRQLSVAPPIRNAHG